MKEVCGEDSDKNLVELLMQRYDGKIPEELKQKILRQKRKATKAYQHTVDLTKESSIGDSSIQGSTGEDSTHGSTGGDASIAARKKPRTEKPVWLQDLEKPTWKRDIGDVVRVEVMSNWTTHLTERALVRRWGSEASLLSFIEGKITESLDRATVQYFVGNQTYLLVDWEDLKNGTARWKLVDKGSAT